MSKTKTSIIILLVLMTVLLCWAPTTSGIAFADEGVEKEYTDVLEDLQKDSTFDASYYPDKPEDYNLQIITLAESTDNELFVYVYHPSAKTKEITASSINISTSILDEINFSNYRLRLLSRQGVFGKYVVEGLTVESIPVRNYAITSIMRPKDTDLGDPPDEAVVASQTISEVPCRVGKQWQFGVLNGKAYVRVIDIETIVVDEESKFCGFVRYPDGFDLKWEACDSHFVAFKTDRRIDELISAKVYFTWQEWERYGSGWLGTSGAWTTTYDDPTFLSKGEKEVTVTCDDYASFDGNALFSKEYKWSRIQSVDTFVETVEFDEDVYSNAAIDVRLASKLTDEAKAALKKNEWVLRFWETPYTVETISSFGNSQRTKQTGTIVGDVMILQLEFVTDGITYNLGAVDNKQSGDPFEPVNPDAGYTVKPGTIFDFLTGRGNNGKKWWEYLLEALYILLGVVVVALIVWAVYKFFSLFKSNKSVTKIQIPVQPDKPKEEVQKVKPAKKPKKKLKLKLPKLPKLKKRGAAESTKKNKKE